MRRSSPRGIPTLLGALLLGSTGPAQVAASRWQAGTAREVITPEAPSWMAGYAGRPRPAAEKIHDLWAKALVLQDDQGARAVLVTLDVTGIDRRFSLRVRDELKERYGLERHQVALCSSHTHSGPVTSDRFSFVFGLSEEFHRRRLEYLDRLHGTIVRIVGTALGALQPCRLFAGQGRADFAANRRNNREEDVVRLRQEGRLRGPMDPAVPVIAVRTGSGDGGLLALVFGYACHCTTLGPANLKWCGDFAGFAQIDIERDHPGCTALFFAGCGGDQNPGPRRNLRHALDHGRALAAAVGAVVKGEQGGLAPIGPGLGTSYREIEVPFADPPSLARLEAEAADPKNPGMALRAKFLLDRVRSGYPLRPTYPYPVQVWRLGPEHLFVTLGGEAVAEYALRIKAELGPTRTFVASYANDVMAYIPSQRVLREGGYEGRTSMMVYGLPAPFGPQIEPLILRGVREQVRELFGSTGAAGPPATGTALDFEDSAGVLNDALWYVSGGTNAIRLRTGTRAHESKWALSTAGDDDYPTCTSNVSQSRIDVNTGIAWGPIFTLRDPLPAGARITARIAGGSKPFADDPVRGPTGLALWDVARADFARGPDGRPRYAACETNGFDFEPVTLPLEGLAGRTLALVLLDRASQSWAWTSVDDIVISEGSFEPGRNHHHQVTLIGEFDDPDGMAGWEGDTGSFRVDHAAPGRPLFVNRRVRGRRHTFPTNSGYLGSSGLAGATATGAVQSPEFTLDGHIVEFYAAAEGGADTAVELVAGGKVLARTTPPTGAFAYHFWRIEEDWRGRRARIRIVDRSTSGGIDVDAIRMVEFDVPRDRPRAEGGPAVLRSRLPVEPPAPQPERTPEPEKTPENGKEKAQETGKEATERRPGEQGAETRRPAGVPRLVPRVVDNRSGGKTVIHPTVTWSFSTARLNGEIRPELPKPGVVRLRYKPRDYDVLPEIPLHALLMPEWLLKPGNGRKGIFWPPLRARPRVDIEAGSILFRVDAAQTLDWNMDLTFRYTPERDWIDFECTIVPHVAIPAFELFVASYVTEDMESTWVSAARDGGEVFERIDCRRTEPWGSVYTVARDAKAKALLQDGRWQLPKKEAGTDLWQDYFFARPILVAMKAESGLAVVTMVDPAVCSLLAGQHHRVETAHDFALNADLLPDKPFTGRARVVVREIGRFPGAKQAIDRMWEEFLRDLAR